MKENVPFPKKKKEKKRKEKKEGNEGRRTLIIQLETWLMLRPVSEQSHFFSSSVG
jgi:hypothetical protein